VPERARRSGSGSGRAQRLLRLSPGMSARSPAYATQGRRYRDVRSDQSRLADVTVRRCAGHWIDQLRNRRPQQQNSTAAVTVRPASETEACAVLEWRRLAR